ncbi:TIGR03086 family metal-binding protein [Actinomadura macrotermitis]|uniref:Mycothiol-dependent maleylpyruvate isomerase metal-binding domain-containing protein n=1 Tax=Actinomadura macrotermitis TaxID=2585200 RepID=A0A7K0BV27_9ACTN|nr:TIGR03086 family metal-binding protein [Actinomadura macrotermitis]MQY04916.1 hypothetical protein [Actinomadura macrotermitis]
MEPEFDLGPAARAVAGLLADVTDEQLKGPTPCPGYTLGDLIDHVGGLSQALVHSARKEPKEERPGDASRLPAGWREEFAGRLDGLAEAWRDPAAWDGMTQAGGLDLPGAVVATVALNELVVHGWDVARATGRPWTAEPAHIEACMKLYAGLPDEAREPGGPFGPRAEVPADATPLDELVALSGRDPSWRP